MNQQDYEVNKRLDNIEKKLKQDEEVISICGLLLTFYLIGNIIWQVFS